MKRMERVIFGEKIRVVHFYLIFLLLFASISCQTDSAGKSRDSEKPGARRVKVTKAIQSKLPRAVVVNGTLAAEEQVDLSMKVAGRILQIFVDLGSKVRQGQPLIKLEPADFELRVRQAEAAYEQARVRLGLMPGSQEQVEDIDPQQMGVVRQAKALLEEARLTQERMESLFKDGLIAHSQLDDAMAAFQVADARYQDALEEARNRQALMIQRRAELDIARKQLSDSTLHAPIDGGIQERHVSPGQFVAVGDKVLTVVRIDPLRLKLALPERESADVRKDQEVRIRVEGDPDTYTGHIARISPAISADNRTLMVEAEVSNKDGRLRPGSFARAEIITKSEQPVILVPDSSIITFAGITKVMSLERNQTIEKRVKTGRKSGKWVEVVEGISSGEPVVVEPGNLVSGEAVNPVW
jgi:RND family efflux transporter MFP subunit